MLLTALGGTDTVEEAFKAVRAGLRPPADGAGGWARMEGIVGKVNGFAFSIHIVSLGSENLVIFIV